MAGERQKLFQQSFENYFKNNEQGKGSIFAGFMNDPKKKKAAVTDPAVDPAVDPTAQVPGGAQQPFAWSFPQYSQSWAFTPPPPTPYMTPNPFDTSKYGDPFKKKK